MNRVNLFKSIQPIVSRKEELSSVRASLPSHAYCRRLTCSGYLKACMPDVGQVLVQLDQIDTSALSKGFHINASYSRTFDFEFHPCHDDILGVLTDGTFHLHRIPLQYDGTFDPSRDQSDKLLSYPGAQQFRFHPTIESSVLLFGESTPGLSWLDVNAQRTVGEIKLEGGCKSLSFDYYGRACAVDQWTDSGISIGLFDLRQEKGSQSASADAITDYLTNSSLALSYLDGQSNSPYLLASYLNRRKYNVISLYDVRKMTTPVASDIEVGHTRTKPTTVYWPMFDPDTGLVYLALRDQRTIIHMTGLNGTSFTPFNQPSTVLPENILAVEIASKRALNTFLGEIDRLIVLSTSGLRDVSYQITRKSTYTFPSGLYPETRSPYTLLSMADLESEFAAKSQLKLVSLDPQISNVHSRLRFGKKLNALTFIELIKTLEQTNEEPSLIEQTKEKEMNPSTRPAPPPKPTLKPKPKPKASLSIEPNRQASLETFKYVQGSVHGRIYLSLPQTSYPANVDCFRVTPKFALFLTGPTCNQLAFVGLEQATEDKHRRFAHSHIHSAQPITDFALDPFGRKTVRVALGLANGKVQIYTLSKETLDQVDQSIVVEEFEMELVPSRIDFKAHFKTTNVTSLQFSPFVSDLLAAAVGRSVFVWNLAEESEMVKLDLDNAIQSMAWNPLRSERAQLAAIGDGELTVFATPTGEVVFRAKLPQAYSQCRLIWIQGGDAILVSVVERSFKRKLYLYRIDGQDRKPEIVELDSSSPSLLVPYHYDESSSIVYLSTRGDNTIYLFQVVPTGEQLNLKPLQNFSPPGSQHQCLSFLGKQHCEVTKCEVATGYRLTFDSIESLRFTVPRTDLEYFHDELYPLTLDQLNPLLSPDEWARNVTRDPILVSLAPKAMQLYSEVRERLQRERAEKREQEKKDRERQRVLESQGGEQMLLMAERFQVMELSAKEHQETLFNQMSSLIHNHDEDQVKKPENNNNDEEEDDDDSWAE